MKVKELRKKRRMYDITQEKLAERLGISSNYVGMIESGYRNMPDDLYSKWVRCLNELINEKENS